MRANIIEPEAYWELRKPYDKRLPESVSEDEVEAELKTIQKRFRELIHANGEEGEAWELPGHYQHVRVFYVYLYAASLYTPALAETMAAALDGFDSWIGEMECYSVPGLEKDCMFLPVFLKGEFYLDVDDGPGEFVRALQLESIGSVGPKSFWKRLFRCRGSTESRTSR